MMDTVGKSSVRKMPRRDRSFLPEDIVIDILGRLPVKALMKFRLVCKGWGKIITARDFVDCHYKTSIPLILYSTIKKSAIEFFAFDQWWEESTRTRRIKIPKRRLGPIPDSSTVGFSHAGLIVIGWIDLPEPEFWILNPARPSRECVKITVSEQIGEVDLCAVYYHSSLNDYCCLFKISESWTFSYSPTQFKLLNLGSNPSLKTITYPFSHQLKDEDAYPLFMNNYIYWMLSCGQELRHSGRNDILEFDIVSEDFRVIPCPMPLNTRCMYYQTHLLTSCDGVLSFVLVLPNTITIWRLEDRVEKLWTSTEYTVSIQTVSIQISQGFNLIALVDGILAFEHQGRLFLCNLREGTVTNYPKRKSKVFRSFFSHQMSLASLKSCKSELYINEDGVVFG